MAAHSWNSPRSLAGDPEQLGYHEDGQRIGQRVHHVEPVAVLDGVEQFRGDGVDPGFESGDDARGERLTDESAQLAVLRRVHADEVALAEGLEVRLGGGQPGEVRGVGRRVGEHGGDTPVVQHLPEVLPLVMAYGGGLAQGAPPADQIVEGERCLFQFVAGHRYSLKCGSGRARSSPAVKALDWLAAIPLEKRIAV